LGGLFYKPLVEILPNL